MKKKGKKRVDDIEVNMQIAMPRVLVDSREEGYTERAEKIMKVLSQSCLAMISANKDVQLCMNMINFVTERNKVLHIAFNQDKPFDVDHFRMLIIAITSAYEELMGGFQIKIESPIDFAQIEAANGIQDIIP